MLHAIPLLLLNAPAWAVPAQLTTQGRILDEDGVAVEDTLTVTFRLLDSDSGGTTLWEEQQSVSLTNGFYSVILGADEDDNPLEDDVLDQWPLWMEVQLDGEPAMVPRMSVGSVPFARHAGVAAGLSPGASIDAESLSIGGSEVIDSDGAWTGVVSVLDWLALTGVPEGFSDGEDADTLADLVCADQEWAVFHAKKSLWYCDGFADTTLTDADVVSAVEGGAVDLFSGSMVDGAAILTEGDTIEWGWLIELPGGLDDGDDDALSALGCSDGELAVYSTSDAAWVCGTDTSLTSTDVVAAVESASSIGMTGTLSVGGYTVLTESSQISWSSLSDVPDGIDDGDDDALSALACESDQVPVYDSDGGEWQCGTASGGLVDSDSALATLDTLSVTLSDSSAPALVQAWVKDNSGSWFLASTGSETPHWCESCGDGSDGAYSGSGSLSGEYSYSSFELASSDSISCGGSSPLVIRSQNAVIISGSIALSGDAGSGTSGASEGCGGYSGGQGTTWYSCCSAAGGGPGGGEATSCSGGGSTTGVSGTYAVSLGDEWWLAAGLYDYTTVEGGSGGSGGCYDYSGKTGGGGGAGGGVLIVIAPRVQIDGSIDVSGGAGGAADVSGGTGSGGVVWIRAASVDISGSVDVGSGLLRIDAHEIEYSGSYVPGNTSGLPHLLDVQRDSTGIVTLTNHSSESLDAVLIATQ